ncbi:MAG: autotransporter outer membrane beta-barrel domain-containing protein [Akkermansia sp.]|nr:autotransporter outer membrane beta-barrel domain-containing protein [Akkermansia sp.]
MKTHIPTTLRKALLAALFATASIATTAYAGAGVTDVVNSSEGWASPWLSLSTYDSTGYTDLTLNGTDSMLGWVDHWCHDWDAVSGADDNDGEDTYIYLTPDASTGKFIAHSIKAKQGKDENTDIHDPDSHDHTDHATYGYSTSWSNGNITVDNEAVLEVTTNINAHGTLDILGSSSVTAGSSVNAGEIKVTSGQLTAKDISATVKKLWNPGDDDYDSTGELLVSGSGAEVTATGTVSAAGGVNVSNGAHLNAGKITATVSGENGYVRALAGQNLVVAGVASEGTQYIVDNGCTIAIGSIGYYDEDAKVMHGNGNFFGFGPDSNNIKADAVYVMGDIISDSNSLAALGGAVDDRSAKPSCNAILVNGSITGNGNSLFVRSQDAAGIWVDKNISGNNNDLTINDGDIHIGGALGRTKDGDNGAVGNTLTAGNDITIGALSDNEDLNIDAWNGEVIVEKVSEGTLVNACITAEDSITFYSQGEDTKSDKVLSLVGGEVESENGDIVSNQVLRVNGTKLTAEEGDINVYALTYDPANMEKTGIQATTNNLIADKELSLDGTGTDSFVKVTEDMRTTKGSIAITNFTTTDSVKVGQDVVSADSITVKNVDGMRVGTIDEEGVETPGNMTAKKNIDIVNSIAEVLGDMEATDGSISIRMPEDGTRSFVRVAGNQLAGTDIYVSKSNLFVGTRVVEEDADGEPVYSVEGGSQISGGDISVIDSLVEVLDSMVTAEDGRVVASGNSDVSVGTQVITDSLIVADKSEMTVNVATENMPMDENSVLKVNELQVDDFAYLHTGNVELTAAKETIHGVVEAGVKDYSDPTKDIAANWKVTGTHYINGGNAHLMANGDIDIITGEEGHTSISKGAAVSATGDVTIQGLEAALAEIDAATVRADGNIVLDNVKITDNDTDYVTDITTKGSDIVLKNHVEISDTILNALAPEDGEPGYIDVTEGANVQIVKSSDPDITANINVFNGRLAGTGNITANDYGLVLYHDATAFNGVIRMETEEHDIEQALYIACEGVGEDATIYLKEGNALYTYLGGQDAHLGNVVADDGSHIQLAAVEEGKGNRATATSLNMTSGATYEVLATTGAKTGALVSDRITVSRGIDAHGAKVAVHTTEGMNTVADGSRFTIVAGEVVTGFNEDVLYDRVKPIGGSSSTLRRLQTRNMHLEHNANGVDLVVSENYKGLNSKNANVNAVREVLIPLDFAADHRPGVLAQSSSNLDHILDALDYTRSGGDAEKGLLSVSAAANLIVPNMMMDSTRHHLSTLRDHMHAPVCSKTVESKGNLWAAYSGGHDYIGGDDNMDKYSHNYNGAIIGGDYVVNCNWAIGLSAGYEGSIARTTGTRADVDTTYIDAYAVGRTGKFIHKFSVGVGIHRSDVTRATNIAAKGHDYHGVSKGKVKSTSVNFGYDVARLYAIDEVSSISPFFAVDLGIQNLKDLNERGQGDASVVTKYKNFTQLDAALGVSYAHTFQAFAQQAGVFSVSLAMHSEFSAHRATANNHFVDTPADTWKTRSAKRAPFYGELGGNVLVPFSEHFSGTAGMSFEFSTDRTYIGGHAGVNYRF